MKQKYPKIGSVVINDEFWTPYLNNIHHVMIPYVFKKFEETKWFDNFINVIKKNGEKHIGPPFTDGNIFEALRGACDFLAVDYDPVLEAYIDKVISIIIQTADQDGYLSTATMQDYPDKRWGDNDGDIVHQHDLYNHGCLIEAAISHYNATKKKTLLVVAVKAANLICATIGNAPKKNIVPGHSLPEEAFVKLYRLFRDDKGLEDFISQYNIKYQDYLDIAEFWYDARGNHTGRFMAKKFTPEYSQDHLPFARQFDAVGHSVRAMLCYLGATVVAQEKNRKDYFDALTALWNNVVYKKLHISGGIGARHDIEGFDIDYNLPNKAYLETCAAIGLAFWNTEMNLVYNDSKYFDCFERSLYNNILSAIGSDFKHFFYQNPLESDGKLRRWEWHECPCCPPMLLKMFSALNSFIYSYDEDSININMFIGSNYENDIFSIKQIGKKIVVDSKGRKLTIRIRIPEYIENFTMSKEFKIENGYAIVEDVWDDTTPIIMNYDIPIRRVYCNPKVIENQGKVAIMYGPFVMCAEGYDNCGNIDVEIAENPKFIFNTDNVCLKTSDGKDLFMIPYYKWCNRGNEDSDYKMKVWLKQQNIHDLSYLEKNIGEKLYEVYK